MHLKINSILRITDGVQDGIYRVIALPPEHQVAILYRLVDERTDVSQVANEQSAPNLVGKTERLLYIDTEIVRTLAECCQLQEVELEVDSKYLVGKEMLSERERAIFEQRCAIAGPFLNHQKVSEALMTRRGIGGLISEIRSAHPVARASCYRMWELLCRHGLNQRSLNPRFDRCGAPGKFRYWEKNKPKVGRKTQKERLGITEPFPQLGVSEEIRYKIAATYKGLRRDPKLKFDAIYTKTIDNCFSQKYRNENGDIKAVPLVQGTYPNKAQVRRIIHQETDRLARKLARTTAGYFARNYRGLTGKSWQGVAGPGHVYAIDSTVGDMFLRSRVNRAWSIGRPVVYIVVDIWSTAVVGFHVCLSGPSWATAKVALFSTSSEQSSSTNLWGLDAVAQLNPAPTLPHAFLCDRGEYLSKGAEATGKELGVNMQYNPSYRPDLKGIVEVLHRITKDQQFQFVPGAIDARRKEIDIRADPKDSIFTLDEYVIYLTEIFAQYNFFSDRSHRMNTDMIAAGVEPSPAGLWRYGHEVGIGYQKVELPARLMSELLPSARAKIRKDGLYFGDLKYEAEFVNEKSWPALARNFGTMECAVRYFPGNNSKIWWQDPESGEMRPLTLASTALAAPGISFDEWLDARAYARAKNNDREHERVANAVAQLGRRQELIANAKQQTLLADKEHEGPIPTMRDAKALEVSIQSLATNVSPEPHASKTIFDREDGFYDALMDELFSTEEGAKA